MKKEEIFRQLDLLERDGRLRNNGAGNLFEYQEEPMGIFVCLSKEAAFREIEIILQTEALLHSEIVAIYTEITFGSRFFERKLAEPEAENLIALKNGVFNLTTRELEEKSPTFCLRHGLAITYKKGCLLSEAPHYSQYLRCSLNLKKTVLQNEPKVIRLHQGVGYVVTNLCGGKKAPLLIGAANSGKSLYLRLVEQVVGKAQCVGMTLPDITDRFRTNFLKNHHIILIHELLGSPIRRLDFLKKFFAGEPLIVEAKGKQPMEIVSYGKPLMAANSMPELGETDVGGGFATRLLPIVFTKTEIPEAERDPKLLEKILTEADIIFSVIVDAAADLLANNLEFATEADGDALLANYQHECDAVPRFIEERCEQTSQSVLSLREVYDAFGEYCQNNCIELGITKKYTAFRNRILQMGYEISKRRVRNNENPRSCLIGLRWKEVSSLCEQQTTDASPQTSELSAKKA